MITTMVMYKVKLSNGELLTCTSKPEKLEEIIKQNKDLLQSKGYQVWEITTWGGWNEKLLFSSVRKTKKTIFTKEALQKAVENWKTGYHGPIECTNNIDYSTLREIKKEMWKKIV